MLMGFTVFFLLMHLVGLSKNTNLRIFNGLIHISIIYLAIREYRKQFPESVSNYISGVAVGMWTSAIGVVGFAIFMALFFVLNPEFLNTVEGNIPIEQYLNPITGTLFILAEGVAISLIGSYLVTRIVDTRFANI